MIDINIIIVILIFIVYNLTISKYDNVEISCNLISIKLKGKKSKKQEININNLMLQYKDI